VTSAADPLLEALRALIEDGLEELPLGSAWLLDAERRWAHACEDCALHRARHRVVYGEGNPLASLLIIGEGPGADEDRLGRPFVGAAGRLLDEILRSSGLSRAAVYITNTIKCRPPRNRDPLPAELSSCRGFLDRQIATIRPRVILSLGKHASEAMLQRDVQITRLRGQVFPLGGVALVPTLHPAYVLRNESARESLEKDLALALSLCRAPQGA
jgi:uracil-DNA glycosylase